jgi:hypothetical protein
VAHFLIPFAFLLSRHVKRSALGLPIGAIFLLVIHCIDMQFLILPTKGSHGRRTVCRPMPAPERTAGRRHRIRPVALPARPRRLPAQHRLGRLRLLRRPARDRHRPRADERAQAPNLLPVRDPRLAESLHFQNL